MSEVFQLSQLVHGENARKNYAEKDVQELAASIKDRGVLQNLVGYKEGKNIAISAGHTRLEALLYLVKTAADGFTPEYPVEVLVRPKKEALADSLVENIQRRDLHPYEEAQAFHRLHSEYGLSVGEIAARSGKPLLAVRKRLSLITDLSQRVQEMLEADQLSLSQAQALTALSLEDQGRILETYGNRFDAKGIDRMVKSHGFVVKNAHFPLEEYTRQGGIIHEDLFGQVESYFDDTELAKRLQWAAVEALKGRMGQRWGWVEVVLEGHFYDWNFDRTQDKAEGGAVIHLHPDTQEVKLYEGLKRRGHQQVGSSPTREPKPRPGITKSGTERTKAAKTRALQTALLGHPQAFKSALAISVLGLLGVQAVRIGFQDQYRDFKTLAVGLEGVFAELAPVVGLEHRPDEPLRLRVYRSNAEQSLLVTLLALPESTLHRLFTALTACAIGSWGGYETNDPSDSALTLALAEHLGARVPQSEMDDTWLKGLSKERLEGVYREIAGDLVGTFTAKELRKLLLERAKLSPEYLPRELSFHARAVSPAVSRPEIIDPTDQEVVVYEDWEDTDQIPDDGEDLDELDEAA